MNSNELTDLKTFIYSILLIATSFLSNLAAHFIDNYDAYFKLLTLASLSTVVIANSYKVVKIIYDAVLKIYTLCKKIKSKIK